MSNYDVSYIFKIVDKFSPAIKEMRNSMKEFQDGIEGMEKKLKKSNARLERFAETMSHVGRKMATYLTAPLVAVGTYAVKNSSEFHMMELSIQAFTGSAEGAAKVLEDIKQQSMEMPISADDLTKTATMLLSTGTSTSDVAKRMRQMSIISLATGQNIVTLTKRLSALHALGSATPRSPARFLPALIQQIREMATQAGLTKSQIDQLFAGGKGKIGWDTIQQALDNLTKVGLPFYNAAIAKSNVWESTLIEIHNALRIMASDLGDVILDFFGIDGSLMSIRDKMKLIVLEFHVFLKSHKTLVQISLAILAISAALAPVLISVAAILSIFAAIGAPVVAIVIGILAVGAGLVYLYRHSEKFREVIASIGTFFKQLWDYAVIIDKQIIDTISKIMNFLSHPFTAKVNVDVDGAQLQQQLHNQVHQFGMASPGGLLSFAPFKHDVTSKVDVNLYAPPGTIRDVRASGNSISTAVKNNLGTNNAFARGYV